MEQLTEAAKNIAVSVTGSEDSTSQEGSSATSKNALKKAAKAAEKAKKKADKEEREASEKERRKADEGVDVAQGKYGVLPLIQSSTRTGIFTAIEL